METGSVRAKGMSPACCPPCRDPLRPPRLNRGNVPGRRALGAERCSCDGAGGLGPLCHPDPARHPIPVRGEEGIVARSPL